MTKKKEKPELKYMMETHLVKESPRNTGLIPSKKWYLSDGRKQGVNPLRTVLNRTFSEGTLRKIQKTEEVDVDWFKEHDVGVIEAYNKFYGEGVGEEQLAKELKESKGVGNGLRGDGNKSPRSIHITQQQWETYLSNGGELNYVFSCEARPDILIIDFDYTLTEDQFQKIQRTFKDTLWVIEQNTEKGSSHIYLQTDNKELRIDKVKANLKENKSDETALDIDIFLNSHKNVSCATPSRTYNVLYDGKPTEQISVRKAITMLSKTLEYNLDKKALEEMLQPEKHQKSIAATTRTTSGEQVDIQVTERETAIITHGQAIMKGVSGLGKREDLYMSLGAGLLEHGFNADKTRYIITEIYEATEENKKENRRLDTLENTIKRYNEGKPTYHYGSFVKFVKELTKDTTLLNHLSKLSQAINNYQYTEQQQSNVITATRLDNKTEATKEVVLLVNDENQVFSDYEATENKYIIQPTYSNYQILVDYDKKNIVKRTKTTKTITSRPSNSTEELIITAVPIDLIVYNDIICGTGKQYQCKWSFEDGTETEINGDIPQHSKTLSKGGGVWNKNQLQNTISAVFGDLTKTKEHGTLVLNTPQQKGFYYDKTKEEITTVNHKIHRPTKQQLHEALELLDTYGSYFGYGYYNPDEPEGEGYIINPYTNEKMQNFKSDPTRLAVFMRWCLNAPFHFVRKQMGMTNDKYIYLTGESGVGKTYGYFIAGLFMLGVEEPKEYLVSGGSNTKAQVSKNLKKTTFPIFFDEGDDILTRDDVKSMLKHSVQGLNSREVTDTDTNELVKDKALAPLGFSSNTQFEDSEKGALTNRILTLPFYIRDVPTDYMRKRFEQEFRTDYLPEDKRQVLKWIGYEFQARIVENPKIYISMNQDEIVKDFFKEVAVECEYPMILDWINNDIEEKTAEDQRKERHTLLTDTIRKLLNKYLQYTFIKEDEMSMTQQSLMEADNLTWKDRLIYLAESRKVSWLNTTIRHDRFIITNGIIPEIRKENPELQINTLEDLNDLLVTAKYDRYDVGRYTYNDEGTRKDAYGSLRIDVGVIADLYKLEE